MLTQLNEQIAENKELSYIDALTGIKNRKAYDEKVQELISLYQRYDTVFSIALLDVDGFKKINDIYGHSAGDLVLKDIAETLQSTTRKEDQMFRIGGEEFIVILPNTKLFDSHKVINKITSKVNLNNQENTKITMSIGLTEVKKEDNKDTLFKRVDSFLYMSKKRGKNQITHNNNPND